MCAGNFCIPLVWHGDLWRGRGENESDPEQRERQYDCEPRPGFSAEPRGEGKGLLQKAGLGALPVLVDECSSNIWQRDLCNDTCYKAAWLFKNLLENEEALQELRISRSMTVWMKYFRRGKRIMEVLGCSR